MKSYWILDHSNGKRNRKILCDNYTGPSSCTKLTAVQL